MLRIVEANSSMLVFRCPLVVASPKAKPGALTLNRRNVASGIQWAGRIACGKYNASKDTNGAKTPVELRIPSTRGLRETRRSTLRFDAGPLLHLSCVRHDNHLPTQLSMASAMQKFAGGTTPGKCLNSPVKLQTSCSDAEDLLVGHL